MFNALILLAMHWHEKRQRQRRQRQQAAAARRLPRAGHSVGLSITLVLCFAAVLARADALSTPEPTTADPTPAPSAAAATGTVPPTPRCGLHETACATVCGSTQPTTACVFTAVKMRLEVACGCGKSGGERAADYDVKTGGGIHPLVKSASPPTGGHARGGSRGDDDAKQRLQTLFAVAVVGSLALVAFAVAKGRPAETVWRFQPRHTPAAATTDLESSSSRTLVGACELTVRRTPLATATLPPPPPPTAKDEALTGPPACCAPEEPTK